MTKMKQGKHVKNNQEKRKKIQQLPAVPAYLI
jgi:hypothetical protein